eukprot:scaffold680_cov264-Pinguiococcus_pyrenoidosus.AAC.15
MASEAKVAGEPSAKSARWRPRAHWVRRLNRSGALHLHFGPQRSAQTRPSPEEQPKKAAVGLGGACATVAARGGRV